MKKNILCIILLTFLLGGCGQTAQAYTKDNPLTLRMAHGAAAESDTGKVIANIEPLVEDKSSGSLDMEIYGSGVLGSERDTIELVQAGVLDIAKISANSLESFDGEYGIFSLPFLFEDEEHLYDVMQNSSEIKKLAKNDEEKGFIAIGWYPSGARNFYTTSDNPILEPDDLKGQKIRVMENETSSNMIKALGGSAVPMSSSETYTALQQGVVDGAENNELALTVNNHKEVAKNYSYTEHQMVPDIFIISTKTLDKLSDAQYEAIVDSLWENNLEYQEANQKLLKEAREVSEEAGVIFHDDIDKEPFIEKVQPMHEDFKAKGSSFADLYNDVIQYAQDAEGGN
ncbi:MAG: TRAP transporter substrate-binding protein [Mycoplasmatales bacterium]